MRVSISRSGAGLLAFLLAGCVASPGVVPQDLGCRFAPSVPVYAGCLRNELLLNTFDGSEDKAALRVYDMKAARTIQSLMSGQIGPTWAVVEIDAAAKEARESQESWLVRFFRWLFS